MDLQRFHEVLDARTNARNEIARLTADMASARNKLSAAAHVEAVLASIEQGSNVLVTARQAITAVDVIESQLRDNDRAQAAAKEELEDTIAGESFTRTLKIVGVIVVVVILLYWLFH